MRRTILLCATLALVLPACMGGTEGVKSSGSTPGATATAATVTGSPMPSPTPQIRTDYDIPPWSDIVAMYEYDTSEPLGYKVTGKELQEGATVYDVTYRGSGPAVPAHLVMPDGHGPFPAVLFAPHYETSASSYLLDAIALARHGYAGLLIEPPRRRLPWAACFEYPCWNAKKNIRAFVIYVVDVRRGIDLLETLPQIDAGRLGLVGGGSGADTGAILTGVDGRVDACVLMGPDGVFTEVARLVEELHPGVGLEGSEMSAWQDGVAVLNLQNYVGHARGTHFLVQDGRDDFYAQGGVLLTLFEAIPEPKTLRWYSPDAYWCTGTSCEPSLRAFVFHRAWLESNV
jgi:hypothetical protein